ncbi:MAG: hypothetical protein Kow0022_09110 [Phycisphaerales bacterium]
MQSRLTRLFVPSIASLVIHLTLLAIVLVATVTVASGPGKRPPLTDIAIAPAQAVAPENPAEPEPAEAGTPSGQILPPSVAPVPTLTARSTGAVQAAVPSLPQPSSAVASIAIEGAEPPRAVSFAGVTAQAAKRIVYVVDASGSMVSSYAFVRARLAQSISHLSPTQRFQVILVRGRPSGEPEVLTLPDSDRSSRDPLLRALPSVRERAIAWLRSIVVSGRSDPIIGLEKALTLDPPPDVVFFLARGFQRSGPNADWGQGVEATLRSLDRLNPPSRRTGLRPVVIKTIQFLDDDPTGLMKAIAEAHGDGPGSFRVLTADDLAEEGADDAPVARDREQDASIRKAGEALRAVGTDELHVLYGIPTPAQVQRVEEAVRLAREALQNCADDAQAAPVRARLLVLESALHEDTQAAAEAAGILDDLFVVDADADAARRILLASALARAGRIEEAGRVAAALASDVSAIGLPEAIADELGVLRMRFGIGTPWSASGAWEQLLIEAEARRLLDDPQARPRALSGLLRWADRDPARAPLAWQLVAAATEGRDLGVFPVDVRFARGLGIARERPDEALSIFLACADEQPLEPSDAAVIRESLWEAAVLARQRTDERAAALLERFALRYPQDDRSIDALVAALSTLPPDASVHRLALQRHLLDIAPDHPAADAWRLEVAAHAGPSEALRVLAGLRGDCPAGEAAAELVCRVVDGSADPALLRSAAELLERLKDRRWASIRTRLVEALLPLDPQAALEAVGSLDRAQPRVALLCAQAMLRTGRTPEALELFHAQATSLSPDRPEFWEAWTFLLEALQRDPSQADVLRAHVFRLRLLDPNLGGPPWRDRIERLAAALDPP